MKSFIRTFFALSFLLTFSVGNIFADSLAPVVSIGSGNGNSPANTAPASASVFDGEIPVFVTVTDTDLDNYHFRIIKDGSLDGHTCSAEGSLFAGVNQGYASTTLGKTACGYVFNQSVYVAPTGFANTQIATLNSKDIIAFSGEGDYWLILGAIDTAGNRTNNNYLEDSKVKITILNQIPAPVVPPTTPVVSGGGGGSSVPANGPVAGSYGSFSMGNTNVQTIIVPTSPVSNETVVTSSNEATGDVALLADGGFIGSGIIDTAGEASGETSAETTEVNESATTSNQVAQAIASGFKPNWLWLVVLAVLGGALYYYYFARKK